MSEEGTDPVGDTVDLIAETIFDWRPPNRRRLTDDYFIVHELAVSIYDAITDTDASPPTRRKR
jgi:hypothetical protein